MTDEEKMAHKLAVTALQNQAQADELIKPTIQAEWRTYVESMGSVMGEAEEMAQRMCDHIDALEAESEKSNIQIKLLVDTLESVLQQRDELAAALRAIANQDPKTARVWDLIDIAQETLSKLEDSQETHNQ